jgi:IS30 family transposase
MEKQYQQLQPEERLTISSMHLQGSSVRAMARTRGRSPATMSLELAHNGRFDSYASVPAHALSVARRIAGRRPVKLDPKSVTRCIVLICWTGKWEGDFIDAAKNASSVGVLVERTSRLVLLSRMDESAA